MLTEYDRQEIMRNANQLLRPGYRSRLGPATCCTLIELWLLRKIELTEDDFDVLVDALHAHLEKAYDEKYRLSASRAQPEGNSDEDEKTDPGKADF